jgi:Flp pilus assembly protein TadG
MHAVNQRFGDTKGQTLPLIVVFMLLLMVVCGMVLDIGNAYRVKTGLQASADAAAAAGADQLPNTGNAASAVQQYGSNPGGKNPVRGSGNVTISSVTNCVTSPKFCDPANTVQVTESTSVPTAFLRVIGINTIPITVHSQACSPCGGKPLDIMIVLDRTGSMAGSKLTDAKAGVNAFLSTMDTGLDNVGLAVLPPATNTSTACAAPDSANYNSTNAAYTLVPLSNTYGTMVNNNIQLNQNSPLLKTLSCVQAGGETAYANALDAAQTEINKDGRAGVQKVIIILSDGAANTGPNYLSNTNPYRTNPCGQAINSASASKASKVLMYSIAYDIAGDGSDPCYAAQGAKVNGKTAGDQDTPEVPRIQSYQALQQIASPGNYYAQPQPSQLTTIFLAISADLAAGTSRING